MRSLLITHIQNARQSMRSNRLRSVLTVIGVTIGVASITAILALGAGANEVVGRQVDSLGGNIAVVRPGESSGGNIIKSISNLDDENHFSTSTLTDSDVAVLEAIPHIKNVAPIMIFSGAVMGTSAAPAATQIVATTPHLHIISGLEVQSGQTLDPTLESKGAVIGAQLSIDLFGTEDSVGKTVRIKNQPFTIIGVLRRTNLPVNYNGLDFDTAIMINLQDGRGLNQGASHIQQINFQSNSVANLNEVIIEANKALLKNHFNKADFTILSGDKIAQPTSQIFTAIAGFSVVISIISLTVGGVGIMNIMLVSVAERTREIGIRKALGATNADITWQFLIESLALSLLGGFTGLIFGYAFAFAVSTFLAFEPVISWQVALTAGVVSIVIGTFFGLYPALKASQKDPITALRKYD